MLKLTFTRKQLHSALARVAPAVSNEETRYYLNGICLAPKNGGVEMVATNGHQLHAVMVHPAIEGEFPSPHPIITNDLIKKILKLKPGRREEDDSAGLTINGNNVTFSIPGIALLGELIDGTFPDYERVIPGEKALYFGQFNANYLITLCQAALAGGSKSVLIRAEPPCEGERVISAPVVTNDSNGGTYVLMPMRPDSALIKRLDAAA